MNISNKSNYEITISNLTSIDLVVLAAMHNTDLKTMIKISALELVKSCEKFFDLEMMQKMNHEPSAELKTKIQNQRQFTISYCRNIGLSATLLLLLINSKKSHLTFP